MAVSNKSRMSPKNAEYARKVLKARNQYGKGKLEVYDIDNISGLETLDQTKPIADLPNLKESEVE